MIESVGKYTYGVDNISIYSWGEGTSLKIGSFCSIGGNIQVFLGGNHRTDWLTTYPFGHIHKDIFTNFSGVGHPATKGSVVIGNDVWIGTNVTIMSGVSIGDGAVIANNSHVVKDVLPYSIVGGNPARIIRSRFDEKTTERLLKFRWWEFEDSEIDEITPLLCSDRICDLLDKYGV